MLVRAADLEENDLHRHPYDERKQPNAENKTLRDATTALEHTKRLLLKANS